MTTDELKARLLTDPDYIFSYILANNPAAVTENFRGLGFTISSDTDVFNALNELLETGEDAKAIAAFSVPMLTDQVDPAEVVVVQQASQALGNVNGMHTKSASQDGTGSGFDIGALFTGLATGALAYLNASGTNKVNQAATNGTAQTSATATAAAAAKATQQKTMWTIIGIGGAVLLVVVILVLRAKK
jgi:ABC-type antimicrobial peptide transport system permease subunit